MQPATILIVEDDEAFGFAVNRYLQFKGFKTVLTDSSMEALKIAETQHIDVVVTDVFLNRGEPHGFALSRILRHSNRKRPVIIMTSQPQLSDEAGEEAPSFVKNQPLGDLVTLINAALAIER